MLNIAAPQVDQVVEDILDSYKLPGAINHIGGPNLPSRQRIIDIWHALHSLLFPGYYEREPVDEESLFYRAGGLGAQEPGGPGASQPVSGLPRAGQARQDSRMPAGRARTRLAGGHV